VTLSFSKAPIDMVLDIFSDLSGRTIIAHPSLPRVFLELKPKGPMSEIGTMEAIQALLAAKGIGIEPLGNKFVRVLPLAQLDAKRVPKNAGAFRVVVENISEYVIKKFDKNGDGKLDEKDQFAIEQVLEYERTLAGKLKIVIPAGHTYQGVPLDPLLEDFSEFTGRTIIAPVNLPRVTFDFSVKSDLSFNDAMELYQALLASRRIGVVLQGDKSALVLPASLLPHAPFYFGVAYRDGKGVEKDEKEAVKWFRKAAEQGHVEGQYMVGHWHSKGIGVTEDKVTGLAWLSIARDNDWGGQEDYICPRRNDDPRPNRQGTGAFQGDN